MKGCEARAPEGAVDTLQTVKAATLQRMRNLKGVVLDLDGVLFEGTNEGYFDAHARALSAVGLDIPREDQRALLLKYWSHPHRFQLALFISDDELLDSACAEYESFLFSEEFTARISEIPGASAAIERLVALKMRLGAATGMHHEQVPTALRQIGINPDVLSAVISGYEVGDEFQKPHPYMLMSILNRLALDARNALYIGDSKGDISMARAAGVLSVAVLTGNMTYAEARKERADIVLPSIHDFVELLNSTVA